MTRLILSSGSSDGWLTQAKSIVQVLTTKEGVIKH